MKNYIFALIIISFVVISGCERAGEEAIEPDILAQIALLPQDANILGYAHFQKIHESPFFTTLTDSSFDELWLDDDYMEFYQQTKLDLQKDIHKILPLP